jgi:hypothetical protein
VTGVSRLQALATEWGGPGRQSTILVDVSVLVDIRKNIHVLSESYEEKGVCLKIKANPGTLTALKQRLAS